MKTLEEFDFNKADASVYLYLAKKGPKKASEISKSLKMTKQQLYPIIKKLQKKGIVNSTFERPARFSAVTFDLLFDRFMQEKMEEMKRIQDRKKQLLAEWKSFNVEDKQQNFDKFAVLEGRRFIYTKIQQMAKEAKNRFYIIFPFSTLVRLNQYGVFDEINPEIESSKTSYCFITDFFSQNGFSLNSIFEKSFKTKVAVSGKNPSFGLKLSPYLVIKDDKEILLFIKPKVPNKTVADDESCLWTNCKSIIEAFQYVFDDLWKKSITFEELKNFKEIDAEINKPENSKIFQTKLLTTVNSAQNEIIAFLSIEGLNYFLKKIYPIRTVKNPNLIIKILAPITRRNYGLIQGLPEAIKIKHLFESNFETIIVDGKELFQFNFKKSDVDDESSKTFDNTFYTNEDEFVLKMKLMLQNFWVNSQFISDVSLDFFSEKQNKKDVSLDKTYTYSKPNSPYRKMIISYEEKPRTVTEQDVLKKIRDGKKHLIKNPTIDKAVFYGTRAAALINPPDFLNLPKMIISVSNWNEKSSYGPENWMVINLLNETENGSKFVPTALIQDSSVGLEFKKDLYANTPASENIQILENGQFTTLVYGETLFVGWTKPILLVPNKHIMPPACLIFEGYGPVKSGIIDAILPSKRKNNWQYNGFEAFVTFYHPLSKYSGPGIDGTLSREVILTSYRDLD
ncbi:MAG: helix-turn-helix domain-containing protein [Candidatus Bathyarchaeota archaeon]